jgi:hypothetical protein
MGKPGPCRLLVPIERLKMAMGYPLGRTGGKPHQLQIHPSSVASSPRVLSGP